MQVNNTFYRWFKLAPYLVIVGLIVLYVANCNKVKQYERIRNLSTAQIDSIEAPFQRLLSLDNKTIALLVRERDSVISEKDSLDKKMQLVATSASNAYYRYREAKEARDTPRIVLTCDSLAEINQILLGVISSNEEYTDTLTRIYTQHTALLEKQIRLKDSMYAALRKECAVSLSKNIDLSMKLSKEKAKKWSIGIGGGYGIGNHFRRTPFLGVSISRKLFEF